MYRIGVIGSDNSHVDQYCKMFNLDQEPHIEGAKIVAIYGLEEKRTREVAENGKIPEIVASPDELLDKIDAAIVQFRHGDLHLPYALPLIEKGIPVFVDKPFCIKVDDCLKLVEVAEKHNVPIFSCSALRYESRVHEFIRKLNEKVGEVVTGLVTGPATLENEYGGISFYGIHVSEMLLSVFGRGVCKIKAFEKNADVIAQAEYKDKIITLNLLSRANYVFHLAAFGTQNWHAQEIQVTDGFVNSMKEFLRMLDEKKPVLEYSEMVESVRIMEAIEESYKNQGKEILL